MSDSHSGEKNKGGRPSIYTQELADRICELIATTSFGIKKLCSIYPDLPDQETIWKWRYKISEFANQYALAKEQQIENYVEETMDIADNGNNDWMEALPEDEQSQGWKINGEALNRSRLRIDTRKWHASKLKPKKYGNNVDNNSTDNTKSLAEQFAEFVATKQK